jgi:acyl-CoA synthetase (AMP-forming)/AMP-acid ligase II
VIYTSGSTGWPKGVQIPHRAVVNFLHSMQREPGFTNADTLLAMQLMARVRSDFQAEISLRNIFEAPTIAELAAILDRKKNAPAAPELLPLARTPGMTARHAQELLDRLDELSDTEVESLLQQMSAASGGKL